MAGAKARTDDAIMLHGGAACRKLRFGAQLQRVGWNSTKRSLGTGPWARRCT